jgi:competence protein ComGC
MDFHFTLRDEGMRATFQLLHMILEVCIYRFLIYLVIPNISVGLKLCSLFVTE